MFISRVVSVYLSFSLVCLCFISSAVFFGGGRGECGWDTLFVGWLRVKV